MKRFISFALVTLISLILLGAGGAFGLYIYMSHDLPSITKVHDYRLPQVTTVYARDGSVMGQLFEEKRFLVNLDQMPRYAIDAFLAAEDARFFEHQGIDFRGILRAVLSNLVAGEATKGGSTITQQVIKRVLLTPERSYERKAKEAILSYQLEKYLTKEEILYLYVNQIFFGNNAYGVEAAARTYFAKHVQDLTVAEAALVAGLPQAPSKFNPYRNPTDARTRQLYVLEQMLDKGFITRAVYEQAKAEPLVYKSMPEPSWTVGAWYLEEVRRQLIEFFKEDNVKALGLPIDIYGKDAVYQAGLHVYTAMDPVHQVAAENSLREGLHAACKRRGWRGPLENIAPDKYANFLKKHPFAPAMLENAGWVQGLVVQVDKEKATVRLGNEYTGTISIKTTGWARTPNTNISPEAAGQVRDLTRVLTVGDVVWVSAIGTQGTENPVSVPAKAGTKKDPGVPAYQASNMRPATPIALALEQWPDLQGAVASIDIASGDLVAIAGGYAFSTESQFNRATQATRQPGSSFKPIVYSAALDNGFTAGSILLDEPFVLPAAAGRAEWKPGNFDGSYLGPIPLITALAKSRNACTVRVAYQIGVQAMVQRARDLGIPGNIPPVLALSLGSYEATPLTMAEAYTAFANEGKYVQSRKITKIQNSWREDLVDFVPNVRQAISPQNAYIMSYLLKEVATAGTGARASVLGRPVGGKTGTSNDERDGWFIGISPYITTSVWVGYDNNSPMGRMETGGRAALPIFIKYRQMVDSLYPPQDFKVPEGITTANIDMETGFLSGPGTAKSRVLPFIAGTEPTVVSGERFAPMDEATEGGIDLLKQF